MFFGNLILQELCPPLLILAKVQRYTFYLMTYGSVTKSEIFKMVKSA